MTSLIQCFTRFAHVAIRARSIAVLMLLTFASGAVTAQTRFATPQAAADAFVEAIALNDDAQLAALLGKTWHSLIPLERIEADMRYAFLEKAHESRQIRIRDAQAELVVGKDPWVLPIPMTRTSDGKWYFDPIAGREEIQARRIGANELAAMQAVLAYVDAQREYATEDRNGDGLLEYAQKLLSSPGKRDGLIWNVSAGNESPLGEDYLPRRRGQGYHGYRYRILTGQGPSAKGGARSYLIGRRMVSGFALIAWPLRYGETGVMSFLVNQDGKIFESDLGPQTARRAAAITRFDPDKRWREVKP